MVVMAIRASRLVLKALRQILFGTLVIVAAFSILNVGCMAIRWGVIQMINRSPN